MLPQVLLSTSYVHRSLGQLSFIYDTWRLQLPYLKTPSNLYIQSIPMTYVRSTLLLTYFQCGAWCVLIIESGTKSPITGAIVFPHKGAGRGQLQGLHLTHTIRPSHRRLNRSAHKTHWHIQKRRLCRFKCHFLQDLYRDRTKADNRHENAESWKKTVRCR
jgi:hypothetical protein